MNSYQSLCNVKIRIICGFWQEATYFDVVFWAKKNCLIFNEKSESCFDLRELNEINYIISLSDCMCVKCVGRCLIFGLIFWCEKSLYIYLVGKCCIFRVTSIVFVIYFDF